MKDYANLPKEVLLRKLQRDTLSRQETEETLERLSLELFYANQKAETSLMVNQTLLEQYQLAVDHSAIVSKSDPEGHITYINQAFVEVSGYSEKEVIGQPHSILRHPETPKWVFKDLWNTIQSKKVWKGQLKNRRKDGSDYYVDTTIVPILNADGEIREFISIRNDVTDIVLLQKEVFETQKEIVLTLSELSETRSKETGFHVKRVGEYSYRLARLYGLAEDEAQIVYAAAPMHDIGKIGIPDSILLKPGKLSDEEFEIMKTHAEKGYEIFSKFDRPILKAAAIIAHQHHEKWNGSGYPQGIAGKDIHLYGRITAVADVFDALLSKRSYKASWSINETRDFFVQQSGKHFDPKITEVFLNNFEDFIDIFNRWSDE